MRSTTPAATRRSGATRSSARLPPASTIAGRSSPRRAWPSTISMGGRRRTWSTPADSARCADAETVRRPRVPAGTRPVRHRRDRADGGIPPHAARDDRQRVHVWLAAARAGGRVGRAQGADAPAARERAAVRREHPGGGAGAGQPLLRRPGRGGLLAGVRGARRRPGARLRGGGHRGPDRPSLRVRRPHAGRRRGRGAGRAPTGAPVGLLRRSLREARAVSGAARPAPRAVPVLLLSGPITRLVAAVESSPGRAFAVFALVHAALWTLLPTLLCRNLPLDLIEGIASVQEWQIGFWKQPPLLWWQGNIISDMGAT